jgi:hypothetical protein
MSDPQPSHWFDYFIKLFGQVTTRQWRRFFSRLIVSIVVALTISILVLYLGIKFFGFRVQEGKLYLGVYESNLSALVHIDATAGWQGSGIKLKQGDRIKIEPSGIVM